MISLLRKRLNVSRSDWNLNPQGSLLSLCCHDSNRFNHNIRILFLELHLHDPFCKLVGSTFCNYDIRIGFDICTITKLFAIPHRTNSFWEVCSIDICTHNHFFLLASIAIYGDRRPTNNASDGRINNCHLAHNRYHRFHYDSSSEHVTIKSFENGSRIGWCLREFRDLKRLHTTEKTLWFSKMSPHGLLK